MSRWTQDKHKYSAGNLLTSCDAALAARLWSQANVPVHFSQFRHKALQRQNIVVKLVWWPFYSQPQWPRGLSRASAATRLLWLRVRIPPEAWISVTCECCVLLRRGLCDRPISRPETPTEYVCVCVCVIRCNNNPLHLQWLARRGKTKKRITFYIY